MGCQDGKEASVMSWPQKQPRQPVPSSVGRGMSGVQGPHNYMPGHVRSGSLMGKGVRE